MSNKTYPFEMKDMTADEAKKLKLFTGELGGFIRVGPKGYIATHRFKEMAADIYNMEIRSSDVYVVTYARSGTTWTQELVWMVANNLDYEKAKSLTLTERFPFLEFSMMVHPDMTKFFKKQKEGDIEKQKRLEVVSSHIIDRVAAAPSPRFIKTHLPLTLMPPNLLDAKVVYVARDPRDVAVSFYHLCRSMVFMGWSGDFKSFWELLINDLLYWTPFFDHLKEAWEKRHHPNLLFLFYEDMQKDLPAVINRVADFLGKKYSDEQVAQLCEHLKVDSFKKNPSINNVQFKELGLMKPNEEFVRKGKSGGWRDYFDEEMTAQAEKWMEENLRDTDLRFPHLQ
ncbi:unnamed protein product [Leptosia nina]|uniref:Sulfotransferase domain-containing protein n=1 Tax=Leptosia nina TaxID=320188 RepID=A0AAV1J9J4_9NEOP